MLVRPRFCWSFLSVPTESNFLCLSLNSTCWLGYLFVAFILRAAWSGAPNLIVIFVDNRGGVVVQTSRALSQD